MHQLQAVQVLERIKQLGENPFANSIRLSCRHPFAQHYTIYPLLHDAPPYSVNLLKAIGSRYVRMNELYAQLELLLLLNTIVGQRRHIRR